MPTILKADRLTKATLPNCYRYVSIATLAVAQNKALRMRSQILIDHMRTSDDSSIWVRTAEVK